MNVTNLRQPKSTKPTKGAHTAKNTRYAKARVAAGKTIRGLVAEGFGMQTVCRADDGRLPSNPHIRRAYLQAIGLEEE